jgi:hypothetical protein
MSMQYPTAKEVQNCLNIFATEVGDATESPFRVDMVARYGGKAPVYTVVMRSLEKEPIRRKLAEVLQRSLSLGGNSFALMANEAQLVVQYRQDTEGSDPPLAKLGSVG